MDVLIKVVTVEETPCLSIHAEVANEDMGVTVAKAFHEVAEHIINNNGTLDGAPFVYYHGFDDKTTSMECGWPVWQMFLNRVPSKGSQFPGVRRSRPGICDLMKGLSTPIKN